MPNITGLGIVKDGVKGLPLNLSNARKKTWSQIQQMSTAEKKGVIICEDIPLGQEVMIDSDEVAYGNGSVKDVLDGLTPITLLDVDNLSVAAGTFYDTQITHSTILDYKYLCVAIQDTAGTPIWRKAFIPVFSDETRVQNDHIFTVAFLNNVFYSRSFTLDDSSGTLKVRLNVTGYSGEKLLSVRVLGYK